MSDTRVKTSPNSSRNNEYLTLQGAREILASGTIWLHSVDIVHENQPECQIRKPVKSWTHIRVNQSGDELDYRVQRSRKVKALCRTHKWEASKIHYSWDQTQRERDGKSHKRENRFWSSHLFTCHLVTILFCTE